MPRKPAKKTEQPRSSHTLPTQASWIESDRYDRQAFANLRSNSPSLRTLEEVGGTLVPHFADLLQDLFCLLFKYNVIFNPETELRASAALNRTFLTALHEHALIQVLREMTLLDEAKASLCTLLVGEGILELLKSEKTLTRRDMLDLWNVERQEQVVTEMKEVFEHAEELNKSEGTENDAAKLEQVKKRLERRLTAAEASLRQQARGLQEDLQRLDTATKARVQATGIKAAQNLEDASEEAEQWGAALGSGGRSPAARKLELGKRLAGNDKLKKLVRMVGRMKFHALAIRKRVFERTNEELLAIEQGSALDHLLPHELLTLHHPILHKDFQRRLLDQQLLQYSLRGIEEKGKGPMVVCLDGSSSMAGEKELWSKAVTLTLLEIARRQRRPFHSICFSSSETPLQTLDLNTRNRYGVETDRVMDLAEYFPGGGTDFEKPLDAALECLQKSRYKKGDVVFITDGECQVSVEWSEHFREAKAKLAFSLFSILIDVGPSSLGTVRELSDRVTTIKQLTNEGVRDLFLEL